MIRTLTLGCLICLLLVWPSSAQLSGSSLKPDPGTPASDLLQQEAAEAASETVADTVRNIFVKQPVLPVEISLGSDNFMGCLASMERLPRIRKLLHIAREGAPEEKEKLKACLIEMCNFYTNEAPLLPPVVYNEEGGFSGYELSSSVAYPLSAVSYAYLLGLLDERGDTLPLLVKMYQRQQDALYKETQEALKRAGKDPNSRPKEFISNSHSAMLAFACRRFLRTIAGDTAQQSSLTQAQKDVLAQFKQFDSERKAEWVAKHPDSTSQDATEKAMWIDMDLSVQEKVLSFAEKYTSL